MLAITYTNYEYITCNSNKTKCFMSFCQLSCLKISTENLFVNLGVVERRKFLCFIISLGPTSLVDKRQIIGLVRLKSPTKQRISMCNQMVTSEKGSGNYKDLDKTQVKLIPNFTSMPFDYLLISWVTNYVCNRGFLTCLSWIVLIDRELHSLKRLELKFGLSFQNFSTKYL